MKTPDSITLAAKKERPRNDANRPKRVLFGMVAAFSLFANAGSLHAIDRTWNGGGADINWMTNGNWSGGVRPISDDGVFFAGTSTANFNNNETKRFAKIVFLADAGAFTLSGSRVILTNQGITNSSSNLQTVDLDVSFRDSAPTLNAGSAGMTINGRINTSDASGNPATFFATIAKSGSGDLRVTNTGNDHIGWSVTAGALIFSDAAALGTGDIYINASKLVNEGVATQTLSNNFQVKSGTRFEGTAPMIFNGTVSGSSADDGLKVFTVANTGGITFNGDIYLNPTTNPSRPTVGMRIGVAEGSDSSILGVIHNSVANERDVYLEKSNTGALSLNNANLYTGGTTVSAGTLLVENATGSGVGTGAVEIQGGATLGGNGLIALGTGNTIVALSTSLVAPGAGGDDFASLRLSGATNGTAAILQMNLGSKFEFRLGADNASDAVAFLDYHSDGLNLASGGIAVDGTGVQNGTFTLFTFDNITETELELLTSRLALGAGFDDYQAAFASQLEGGIGQIQLTVIPEPATLALLILGLVGTVALKRSKTF